MSQLHDLYYFLFPTPLAAETAKELLRCLQGPRGAGRCEAMCLDRLQALLANSSDGNRRTSVNDDFDVRHLSSASLAFARRARLHITLHYLGRFLNSIPREVIDLALAAGSAMDYEAFGVRLDVLQFRGGFE